MGQKRIVAVAAEWGLHPYFSAEELVAISSRLRRRVIGCNRNGGDVEAALVFASALRMAAE